MSGLPGRERMVSMMSLQGKRAIVTGGSRGLGRGIVQALVAEKVDVVAMARDAAALESVRKDLGVETVSGDVADDAVSGRLLRELRPDLVVLCAGASPPLGSLHEQTWESFSHNWEVDAKSTFFWLRHALLLPMKPGSHVIVVSSGAAVRGSPVSGGYASAKRAQWFMADYAATEAARMGLDLRVHCILPDLNPSTPLGRKGIAAYAQRAGVSDEEFAKRFGPPLTPAIMGKAIVDLASDAKGEKWDKLAYRVTGMGLAPVD
jgi:NAD(P)-dependent dehydrogenase (short-subunit alcohol dehydrogenase family)